MNAVKNLHPGYFAFVMATGIVSIGTFLLGPSWLSRALFVVACAGFAILAVALVIRLIWFRAEVLADVRAPDRVFGFFTIVAGADVLGVRFASAGHPVVTAVLAGLAAAVWLLLTYGIPASLLLWREADSVLAGVNGGWLLWTVSTQSLAIAAATLAPVWPSRAGLLAPFATGLWCVGTVLYLLVVALILARWLTVPVKPKALGPPYWILMGATAISVLAGGKILALPATLPAVAATREFVKGASYTLWAFGTWWIPLLVIFGVWRHLLRRWPLSYEPTMWSVVFPLGMYSVATLTYGKATHLSFTHSLSQVMIWIAVAAWALVSIGFLVSLRKTLFSINARSHHRRSPLRRATP